MARIPIFGLGVSSKSPYVTAKLLQNLYAETRPGDLGGMSEKSSAVAFQTPGLNLFATFGNIPARCGQELEATSLAYVVAGGTFYEINNSGVYTVRGSLLTTSGRCSISDNGQQICIVDGTYGYLYQYAALAVTPKTISSITRVTTLATLTTATAHGLTTGMVVVVSGATPAAYNGTYEVTVTTPTAFTYTMAIDPGGSASPVGTYTVSAFNQIVDPGFPANPTTVVFLNGYFIVTCAMSSRFNTSALYDGYSWPALNFANAATNPDPIVSGWVCNGQFVPLGTRSSEFWGNSGQVAFPFSQVVGTANEWGIASPWSVTKFNNSFAALIKNRLGQVMVGTLSGYLYQEISNPDVDAIFNSYSNVADASSLSYMLGGHQMYVINFPSAGATWLYDGLTSIWTQLKSWMIPRYVGEFSFSFLGKSIVADYANGNLYTLTATALTENGNPIERMLISENIADPDLDRIEANKLRMDFQVGSGATLGQGSNPQVALSISRDNGKTWGSEMWRTLGMIGDYGLTVDWDCLGTARNFVFKFLITDPTPLVIVSAVLNPED